MQHPIAVGNATYINKLSILIQYTVIIIIQAIKFRVQGNKTNSYTFWRMPLNTTGIYKCSYYIYPYRFALIYMLLLLVKQFMVMCKSENTLVYKCKCVTTILFHAYTCLQRGWHVGLYCCYVGFSPTNCLYCIHVFIAVLARWFILLLCWLQSN